MTKRKEWSHNPFAMQSHLLPTKRELRVNHGKPPPPKRNKQVSQWSRPSVPARELTEDELFAQAMADVMPLERRFAESDPLPQTQRVVRSEDEEVRLALEALIAGGGDFDLYYSDEFVEGALPHADPQIVERLRVGDYAWQGYLDLHGLRVDEAKESVSAFVEDQRRRGHRCLLFVHGRGHHSPDRVPVLKRRLVNWITRGFLRKQVLAFATARNHDGGAGALYVLLV